MSRRGLGASDAELRWVGIRRHQALLLITGVVVCADWLTGRHRPVSELVVGLLATLCSAQFSSTRTIGEQLVVGLTFVARGKWSSLQFSQSSDGVLIHSSPETTFAVHELQQTGRLDLTGEDYEVARSIESFCTALSVSVTKGHFSQHVITTSAGHTTLVVTESHLSPQGNWLRNDAAITSLFEESALKPVHIIERWSYLCMEESFKRVLRIQDFASTLHRENLLQTFQRNCPTLDIALHIDVVGSSAAHKRSARAVHQGQSDVGVTQSAGFRKSARSEQAQQRIAQREVEVAAGAALLMIGCYMTITSQSLQALETDTSLVSQRASESGLRLDFGTGVQLQWLRSYLPRGEVS